MPLFCIFEKKGIERNDKKTQLRIIKIGFSKTAFIFTFIWGLSNKLNFPSFITFTLFIIFVLLVSSGFMQYGVFLTIMFLNSCYWGLFANTILANHLIGRDNYVPVKIINSENKLTTLITKLSETS